MSQVSSSNSPTRPVFGDVKNQARIPRPYSTPGNKHISPPLPITSAHKTPLSCRRQPSVLPLEEKYLGVTPRSLLRPTHARRSSIPKSPMLSFRSSISTTPNTPRMPQTCDIVDPASGANHEDLALTASPACIEPLASQRRTSLPPLVRTAGKTPLTTRARTSLAPTPVARTVSKTPCPTRSSHTRRSSIPKAPMIVLSSLRSSAVSTPQAPRDHSPANGASSAKKSSSRAPGFVAFGKPNGLMHRSQLSSDKLLGASCVTLKRATFPGPDATSLLLSTASFNALKTPHLVRDDTCNLPALAGTADAPSSLLMETPSFTALRDVQTKGLSPSCYDLTQDGVMTGAGPLFDYNALCATPRQRDKGAFQTPYTNAQSQSPKHLHPPVPSQSRSLLFLMSALETAVPTIGHSLLTDCSMTDLAGIEEESGELFVMAQGPENRNTNRDTLMLLDEFELLTAEMRALPVPRPPSLSLSEWGDASDDSHSTILGNMVPDHVELPEFTLSVDEHSDDTHSDHTTRPSIDSGRTESPSPPVTPVDPYFPPIVHIISSSNALTESFMPSVPCESTEVSETKTPSATTRRYGELKTPVILSSPHTPSALPRSSNSTYTPLPSKLRRLVSSPLPSSSRPSVIPRTPTLATHGTLLPQDARLNPTPSRRPLSPTPVLKRLFKPRQSAPPVIQTPSGTANSMGIRNGTTRMKRLVKGDKTRAILGESFLDM